MLTVNFKLEFSLYFLIFEVTVLIFFPVLKQLANDSMFK